MITRVPGWSWQPHGGGVTLVPVLGTGAAIRYRERLRPVQTVAAILRDKAADRRFRATATSAVETMVTDEGEYAAVVDLRGVQDAPGAGSPLAVHRTLGFVFGDDWYSELAGIALRPELFDPVAALVRRLVRDVKLSLGIRRRRFIYSSPAGWYGYSRLPQYTTWFPPEHPRDPTSINVYPALPAPLGSIESEELAMLTIGPPAGADVIGEMTPRATVRTQRLTGSAWELDIRDERGRAMARRLVMLRDERYLYTAYLDAVPAELAYQRGAFDALIDSIEPLPGLGVRMQPALSEDWL